MVKTPIRMNAEFDKTDKNVLLVDGTQLKEIIARTVTQILEKRAEHYCLESTGVKRIENTL